MAVERMRGLDASFLYWETPTLHMHSLKVAIVDPSAYPGGYSFEQFRQVLGAGVHLLPAFRLRPVEVPYGLGHPVLIEDPDFDIDRHVRRVQLPEPGSRDQLHAVVGEIAGTQLARDRPLWEITVVEGLPQGQVAFVAKIHHAVADGGAAVAMLQTILQPVSETAPRPVVPAPAPDPIPGKGRLLWHALVAFVQGIVRLPGLLGRTVVARYTIARRRLRGVHRAAPPFHTPVTRFNGAITTERIFSTARLPLADVRAVREAAGVTVNDVVLGICTGALRAYLQSHDELPARPLMASVPVGTDPSAQRHLFGNHVSGLFAVLPTDEVDPLARLRKIHDVTEREKEELHIKGETMFEQWSEYRPGPLISTFSRFYSSRHLADRHRPMFNLVVSSVPGPREPLHTGGARLLEIYSVGPALEGSCLNITAWSYTDTLYFALLASPAQVPDLDFMASLLGEALAELAAEAKALSETA